MKRIISLLSLMFACAAFCQYNIGHTTITFNDPGRTGGFGSGGGTGRQIQTEVYYPADATGDDVPLSSGQFPVIVFGHGFVMSWDAYQNIWEELVSQGYIIAFPRTEGNVSPSHEEFGLDLALVANDLQQLNDSTSSLFNNRLVNRTAIMGHSMGGGATFLAAENNTNITTVIGLAPAETTPSAITTAQNVTVPALVFSADEDMVTPEADHHTPIYNGLASSCKYFINIIGGAHCYYANSNFNCDFGESTSGGNISISRQEQHTIMFNYLIPWLDLHLKNDCSQASVFESDLQQDTDVTYQSSCIAMPSPNYDINVSISGSTLTSDESGTTYQWVDCGDNFAAIAGATNQSYTPAVSGDYAVILGSGTCSDTSACYSIQVFSENKMNELYETVIYPNPTNGIFKVKVTEASQLKIYSTAGAELYRSELYNGINTVSSGLDNGVYLIEVKTESKTTKYRIVIGSEY